MAPIKFVTLFVQGGDALIYKDVGQIPYMLAKNHGFYSEYVGCEFNNDIPEVIDGYLHLTKINKIFGKALLGGLLYIIRYARKISCLNLYHTNRRTLWLSRMYKIFNPHGVVYVKLDCGLQTCDRIDEEKGYRAYFEKCLNLADIITVESELARDRLEKWDKNNKIRLIYNGYSEKGTIPTDYEQKENVFLTVGNLGHDPKGTDILLEAFAKSDLSKSWKLKLIGGVEPDLEDFLTNYYNRYPCIKDRIEFLGYISSRTKIYEEYRKAKVFVMPSLNESYNIASVEALVQGCYLILSDRVTPYKEFTNSGKYGITFPVNDINALSNALLKAASIDYSKKLMKEISTYAKNMFSWELICDDIYNMIMEALQ